MTILFPRALAGDEFAMRNIGHVPPALLAESPTGPIHFIPRTASRTSGPRTTSPTPPG